MNTASTTDPRTQAQPRRRWWLRGLILAALLIAVVAGLFSFWLHAARVSLAEAEADADRSDPDWRLEALEAKRRVVAGADNSALHVIAVMRKGLGVSVRAVPNYDTIFDKLPPTAQLNVDQERLIRGQLSKIAKPLAEARQLKDMPNGRFKIMYSPDFYSTLIPNHHSSREIADWLKHDAFILAHDDHADRAVESCQAIFNAGRTMGDEPFMLTHMIRVAIQMIGVTAVERVLAQSEATDESLDHLQTLLAKEIEESTWRHGLRGERAGSHLLFVKLSNGTVNMRVPTGLKSSGRSRDWLHTNFPSTLMKYFPEHLKNLNRAVELSKLPLHEQRKPLEEMDQDLQTSRNIISSSFSSSYIKVYETDCRSQAHLRATWVALACERYRLKHERWPEALDALVKAKLIDAIPLDPYDGQPLRFRRTNDGIVVYAVGSDQTDDQGRIDGTQTPTPGFDLGFRLWDGDLRRQAPLPPVVIPE